MADVVLKNKTGSQNTYYSIDAVMLKNTSNNLETFLIDNGGVAQPKLHAPQITVSNRSLTITDTANGDFANGYKVYIDGVLHTTIYNKNPIILPAPENASYVVYATAFGTNFIDSDSSNSVSVYRQYRVRFFDGQSILDSEVVNSGTALYTIKPDDPTKIAYEFVGWYQEPELIHSVNFNSAVTQDTNIYAKWVDETYLVSAGNLTFNDYTSNDAYRILTMAYSLNDNLFAVIHCLQNNYKVSVFDVTNSYLQLGSLSLSYVPINLIWYSNDRFMVWGEVIIETYAVSQSGIFTKMNDLPSSGFPVGFKYFSEFNHGHMAILSQISTTQYEVYDVTTGLGVSKVCEFTLSEKSNIHNIFRLYNSDYDIVVAYRDGENDTGSFCSSLLSLYSIKISPFYTVSSDIHIRTDVYSHGSVHFSNNKLYCELPISKDMTSFRYHEFSTIDISNSDHNYNILKSFEPISSLSSVSIYFNYINVDGCYILYDNTGLRVYDSSGTLVQNISKPVFMNDSRWVNSFAYITNVVSRLPQYSGTLCNSMICFSHNGLRCISRKNDLENLLYIYNIRLRT